LTTWAEVTKNALFIGDFAHWVRKLCWKVKIYVDEKPTLLERT